MSRDQEDEQAGAGHARAGGLRHAVAIPARLEGGKGGQVEAEIIDVSSTGMYLRLGMFIDTQDDRILPRGGAVTVVFEPDPARAPGTFVRIPTRVARRSSYGLGLHYDNPQPEHMRVIRAMTVRAVQARARSERASREAAQRTLDPAFARQVCSACLKSIERRMAGLVWSLRTGIINRLMAQTRSPATPSDSTAAADAEAINERGTALGRTIERRVVQAFAEVSGLEETQRIVLAHIKRAKATAAAQAPTRGLGVMGTTESDATALLTDTCHVADRKLASQGFNVNVRLANILGRRIDESTNNPVVPGVMCRMLWESVVEFRDSPPVHVCMRETIIKDVLPLLDELYQELDNVLDRHGVTDSFWLEDKG